MYAIRSYYECNVQRDHDAEGNRQIHNANTCRQYRGCKDADRPPRFFTLDHLLTAISKRQYAEPHDRVRQRVLAAEQQQYIARPDFELAHLFAETLPAARDANESSYNFV